MPPGSSVKMGGVSPHIATPTEGPAINTAPATHLPGLGGQSSLYAFPLPEKYQKAQATGENEHSLRHLRVTSEESVNTAGLSSRPARRPQKRAREAPGIPRHTALRHAGQGHCLLLAFDCFIFKSKIGCWLLLHDLLKRCNSKLWISFPGRT